MWFVQHAVILKAKLGAWKQQMKPYIPQSPFSDVQIVEQQEEK